ncbi:MAG TPA: flagellar hook protein FlgE [Bryobacteraceae bacterium]|jgi:flagellar hook protein FlgE|nr:flagellar hook protein FlgE [Bryobacteraceae bacterium]
MSSTFSIALSALQAESEAINTTGNNLANMNTTGFKGANIAFKDLFGQTLGANGSFQVGLGVNVPISQTIFSQGPIQTSTSSYAAAISGNGFFVLQGSEGQQLFTRDGNFKLAADGTLTTQTGENVQGWTTSNGALNTSGLPGNIVLPAGLVLPPSVTQNLNVAGNLDASATVGSSAGSIQQPVQVVDSLGNQHTLTFDFTKTGGNTWNYNVTVDGGDITGGTAGTQTPLLASPGTLTFDSAGNLVASSNPSSVTINLNNLADGASNMSLNWSLFNSSGTGQMTQYSQTSSVAGKPDGSQSSQLSGIAIQNGGQIVATFDNQQQKVLGQIALAGIQNPDSLTNVGNNNYAATAQTAAPAIGLPQSGGRGQIEGGALESSNVDMATQLTNLIVYQSAYQAASRVITTANEMTQDLLQVVH